MAGERIKLVVSPREHTGTRESRRLRREGLVPGVLYGTGKEPHAISVPERPGPVRELGFGQTNHRPRTP